MGGRGRAGGAIIFAAAVVLVALLRLPESRPSSAGHKAALHRLRWDCSFPLLHTRRGVLQKINALSSARRPTLRALESPTCCFASLPVGRKTTATRKARAKPSLRPAPMRRCDTTSSATTVQAMSALVAGSALALEGAICLRRWSSPAVRVRLQERAWEARVSRCSPPPLVAGTRRRHGHPPASCHWARRSKRQDQSQSRAACACAG